MGTAPESALVDLIQQRTDVLLNAGAGADEQVVFLDNRLTPTPECILRDPSLNPYDKILWQGILSLAQAHNPPGTASAGTVMPTYDCLARMVNVSRMSISTSIAALRATRWLIVKQIRDDHGAMRGQLYVIAYAPWDLRYALEIDDRYIDWLETQTEKRRDRRIRRIAQAVWDTITEDRRRGVDVMAPMDPIANTLEAGKALHDQSGRFYSIGANALKTLKQRPARVDLEVVAIEQDTAEIDRVKLSYSVESIDSIQCDESVQRCHSDRITTSRSSSKYINKTTTTTRTEKNLRPLTFPPSLRAVEQQRIEKVLLGLIPEQPEIQQMLLDELGGRMKWGAGFRGGAAAWFKGTTQAYMRMQDDFVPNYADKYARFRQRQANEQNHTSGSRPARTPQQKQSATEAMALIRQSIPALGSKRGEGS